MVEEWLNAWGPSGRKQEWYSRDGQRFDFGRNLTGEDKAIEALTRPNSLFLSAAAQNNHPQLTPIYQWFSKRLRVLGFSGSTAMDLRLRKASRWWEQFSEKNLTLPNILPELDRRRAQVRSLLSSSDLGIDDFMVEEDRYPGSRGHQGDTNPRRPRLTFAHENKSSLGRVWFELEQESTGTQVLVSVLPHLLHILEEGGLLACRRAEFATSHVGLGDRSALPGPRQESPGGPALVQHARIDPARQPAERSSAVGPRSGVADGEGSRWCNPSYPLTDFKPRPTENLQRGYLQGRYGAIPFVGALDLATKIENGAT